MTWKNPILNYKSLALCGFLCLIYIQSSTAIAVMSVDLGSEWMKVGIVSPGVPMEIALNKESKRKTASIISFRDDTRTFGEDAQTLAIRFPKSTYGYLIDLLGKDINNPIVKLFKQRFPYYDIEEDPVRHTAVFVQDENIRHSVEELVSQLLHKAREFAEQSAGQAIKECVLTVPGYFNHAERTALLEAAQLAGLKVLQLINDYSAVALNYGIFHYKNFNETAKYVLFYDMGASKTTATIVSYQTVKIKERGFVETHPQAAIVGVGFDRTLGGLEMQIRLRDYLARKFNEMQLTKNDVTKNLRSMAKLFKEAGRVKNVLSANADHYAQIENLIDDKDFRLQVTREQFEELCKDIFERVGHPVIKALEMAGLSIDVISNVILVGAGTRVPKVQEQLQAVVKMELSKNLNTDEAATMGAVYKAADLSAGFKVKKFISKDAILFPIHVVFDKQSSENEPVKQIRRTLFGLMNPYPQKKIITFNKHHTDFKFSVNYADLDHLSNDDILAIGSLNISEITLTGVEAAIEKHKSDDAELKGIKAHFIMDDSGLLNLLNVELVVEKLVKEEDESAFAKLGSTISKLFQPVSDEPAPQTEEPSKDEVNQTKPDEPAVLKNDTVTKNETKEDAKPTMTQIKEPIQSTEKLLIISSLSTEQMEISSKKIDKLNEIDRERVDRETALNNLESFVIDTQNKLDTDEFAEAATSEEAEKIKATCSEISEWLYDEGSDATADIYKKKLSDVQDLSRDLYLRVYEHRERPDALGHLKQLLNHSRSFLGNAKNLTFTDNAVFTEVEITNLEKMINETIKWRDDSVAAQKKLKKSDAVTLTVRSIQEKMTLLDREVKYLINKLKIWKPKVPKVKEDAESSKTDNSSSPDGNDRDAPSTPEDESTGEKTAVDEENVEPNPDEHEEL